MIIYRTQQGIQVGDLSIQPIPHALDIRIAKTLAPGIFLVRIRIRRPQTIITAEPRIIPRHDIQNIKCQFPSVKTPVAHFGIDARQCLGIAEFGVKQLIAVHLIGSIHVQPILAGCHREQQHRQS